MSIDEEQPSVALEISIEAKRTIQEKIMSSGIAGVLSLVPGVGGAVTELMTELAIQRTNSRVKDMFEHFTAKIREVGEDKVDREWFRSEEFQTLLYEAFSQLNVTHDHEKIEMLGVALANSGVPGFKEEERKDLFIRFVRELTLQHIKMLVELAPGGLPSLVSPVQPPDEKTQRSLRWNWRPTLEPKDDDLLALQMLHAYGLVEENLKSSIKEPDILPSRFTNDSQIRNAVKRFAKSIENPSVTRTFRISPLGDEFLKFMGLPKSTAPPKP